MFTVGHLHIRLLAGTVGPARFVETDAIRDPISETDPAAGSVCDKRGT